MIQSLLKKAEQLLKTDIHYLLRGSFWMTAGHIFYMLSGLILTIALANLLPKEEYGTYQFVMTMTAVVSAFALAGLETATKRAVARGSDHSFVTAVHTSLKWSGGILFAGGALAIYYYLNDNTTLAISFLIVGTLTPFITAFRLNQAFFIGKQLFKESFIFGIWRRLIPVTSIVATLFFTQDVVALVFVYFTSNALSGFLLYLSIVKKFNQEKGTDTEMVTYGKHLSVMKAFTMIIAQLDKLLVWMFLGAVPMAIYSLAYIPVKHMEGVFKQFFAVTFTKVHQKEYDELKRILPKKSRIIFMAALAAVVAYVLAAPYIFAIAFPAYSEAVFISQLFSLVLLSKARLLYAQAFIAYRMKRQQYTIEISASFVKVIALAVLFPLYGMMGAVSAILLHQLYISLVVRYFFYTQNPQEGGREVG